jgi:hypothetical protein
MKFTSPVFSAVSGSIGGTTFSHNKGGMYTRARAIPTNPNTLRQQDTRLQLGAAVSAWIEDLDASDRNSWNTYAANVPVTNKLGQTVNLSGQQHYVRSFVAWRAAGLSGNPPSLMVAPFDTGNPVAAVVNGLTAAANIGIDSGSMLTDLNIEAGGASEDGAAAIFLGPIISEGRSYWKGPYQRAASVPLSQGGSGSWTTATNALLNSNGAIAIGQRRPILVSVVYEDGRVAQKYRAVLDVLTASA